MMRWQHANPLKVQLWAARMRAREKGLDFGISLADLEAVWPGDERCYICRVAFARVKADPSCPSIDRIDNALGYVPGNIHVICLGCNGRKNDHTLTELARGCDRHFTCAAERADLSRWARHRLGLPARTNVGRRVLHEVAA